jgi:hypothetical protein
MIASQERTSRRLRNQIKIDLESHRPEAVDPFVVRSANRIDPDTVHL